MANLFNKFGIRSNILKHVVNQQLRVRSQNYTDDASTRVERSLNKVTLLGRIGLDPQKRGNDQHPVVTFSLATNTNYKNENGDLLQRTDWHRIVVFRPSLRDYVLNYLTKGQRTLVNGRISYSDVTDADGKSRVSTSIIADDVILLQRGRNSDDEDRE